MNDAYDLPPGDAGGVGRAVSVSELNGHLKAVVEATFPPLWVAGEVTDVTRPRSGHLYFTLKDDDSQIRAIMWRSVVSRLPFKLENGQSLLCFGGLEIYTVRGTYQLVVRKAQPQGVGALQQAFEKLKARLHSEGLFAAERKRPLPKHPRRIAIVTSPSGAAIHDFLVAARRNMLSAEIFVIPAQVQGAGAAETIRRGLQAAAMIRPKLDAVIVARGGGSLEDLWCFNEEPVVRAIAECPVPTVSAVGHEIDVTLADLAADVRALTPTDAATKVFPDRDGITQRVDHLDRRLQRAMQLTMELRRQKLEALERHPMFKRPMEIVHLRSRLMDELEMRARQAMDRQMERARHRLANSAAQLSALSPLKTLARGYSVTLNQSGQAVTHVDQVTDQQQVETIVVGGRFSSVVTSVIPDEPRFGRGDSAE
ncbi:exodeoxyribonuclease VII large subunit [Roseiconus nitratireducens]|uniref:exodeoxyribonuclease VII large subunit n=1 Tax=Roseiconus nitratireducens TaxID=2605748 RepID=UPI001375B2D5|nr:exodeoxyribonuclease VII large subunit [Roseiconus nitratireducens]